mmetsp:Transcript_69996/g.221792  ORF Transcript_69996/g.221792 Transcript_69996/m.221792 type:complete len:260 (-) Transcript_69996:3551-4330(-)
MLDYGAGRHQLESLLLGVLLGCELSSFHNAERGPCRGLFETALVQFPLVGRGVLRAPGAGHTSTLLGGGGDIRSHVDRPHLDEISEAHCPSGRSLEFPAHIHLPLLLKLRELRDQIFFRTLDVVRLEGGREEVVGRGQDLPLLLEHDDALEARVDLLGVILQLVLAQIELVLKRRAFSLHGFVVLLRVEVDSEVAPDFNLCARHLPHLLSVKTPLEPKDLHAKRDSTLCLCEPLPEPSVALLDSLQVGVLLQPLLVLVV